MSGDRRERIAEYVCLVWALAGIVFALAQLWRAMWLGLLI